MELDLKWQARELSEKGIRASLNQDRETENEIRRGSEELLKSLWLAHPKRMRELWQKGLAQTPPKIEVKKSTHKVTPKPSLIPAIGIELARSVAADFLLTRSQLLSPGRQQNLMAGRAIIAKILDERGWSQNRIATAIGRGDHSTVANLLERADYLIDKVPCARLSYERNRAKFIQEAIKRD